MPDEFISRPFLYAAFDEGAFFTRGWYDTVEDTDVWSAVTSDADAWSSVTEDTDTWTEVPVT